ncbi:hypothetical protein KIN20_025772 [Parelaphostrongylus tenuis]|uniref:Uncharacterized protein n=1 Tax=Parelaphostrongylus tenuis TaxID=148309 RepID=A0AAD5MZT9_PARTN|nr:hypothetical protein KIN20_025772 [Parelaphostrongylus tenuis]
MTVFTVTFNISYLLLYVGVFVSAAVLFCGVDKNREKVHVAKRQELKHQQRDAMLAGRPVQSVIEEVEPLMLHSSSRISCVRELPDLEALEKHRLQTKNVSKKSQTRFETFAFLDSTQSKHAMEMKELGRLVGTIPESSTSTRQTSIDGLNSILKKEHSSSHNLHLV